MEAVIDAAVDLFAERGPKATSIRDLAARSGVNHGLVYRHFGSKEQLVGAVLDYLSTDLVTRSEDVEEAAGRHLRVLARVILDGYPVGQLQHSFPFVTSMIEVARAAAPASEDEADIRLRAAHAVALEMGWRLFEPFLRPAAGLTHTPVGEIQRASHEMSRRILEGG